MSVIKIACLGLTGVMLGLFLHQMKAPFAALLSLATCLIILFYSLTKLSSVFELLNQISHFFEGQQEYVRILLKIVGVTYVADFAASLCRDMGYSAIAGQIEIFGKISVLALGAPIILALLETISGLL